MTAALAYLRKNWRPLAVLLALVGLAVAIQCGQPARVVERRKVEWRDRGEETTTKTTRIEEGPKREMRIRKKYAPPPADSPCADRPVEVETIFIDTGPKLTLGAEGTAKKWDNEGKAAAERVVDSRARWRVGALVGAQVALPPALVVGLHGEARVAGPVWAGAWVLADPRWPAGRVEAGVSVGVEW